MSEAGVELPQGIELAWGLRERPGKGPRRSLTLDQVVAAGIRVADAEGLTAVSMSRVAGELGLATMSLYRYVPTKQDLLGLMSDTAYGDPPAPRGPDEQWRPALTRWAGELVDRIRRRPWVRHVPIDGPPMGPRQVGWMEQGLATLDGIGLRGIEPLSTILLISQYARSHAALTLDLVDAATAAGTTPDEAGQRYWQQLEVVTRSGAYPQIRRLMTDLADAEETDADADWRFGLDRILDGIEALVSSRHPG
ncbi:TetR/AcrR family transcriptional regulator [Micromonospora sp. SH-82]|uniref:TetR/AcrR family transcriptional regulator n=1 Tax=Micromonospora sp. SH-82 TaxID=3132938 RepID=UPI003EBDDE38